MSLQNPSLTNYTWEQKKYPFLSLLNLLISLTSDKQKTLSLSCSFLRVLQIFSLLPPWVRKIIREGSKEKLWNKNINLNFSIPRGICSNQNTKNTHFSKATKTPTFFPKRTNNNKKRIKQDELAFLEGDFLNKKEKSGKSEQSKEGRINWEVKGNKTEVIIIKTFGLIWRGGI